MGNTIHSLSTEVQHAHKKTVFSNAFLLEMLFIDLFARKYLDCKGMFFFLFETCFAS